MTKRTQQNKVKNSSKKKHKVEKFVSSSPDGSFDRFVYMRNGREVEDPKKNKNKKNKNKRNKNKK